MRIALTVSRAMILPPMQACTGTSKSWRGIFSLSFSTIFRALGYALSAWMMNDSASTTSPLSMMSSLTRLLFW